MSVRVALPVIAAAGVVEKGGTVIRIAGVIATPADAVCGTGAQAWPCGRVAKTQLQRMVRGRALDCRFLGGDAGTARSAHCAVAGRDLGEWLVAQGWAKADGPDHAELEAAARREKLGVWSPTRPERTVDPSFIIGTPLTDAPVRVEVSIATQTLTLTHRGELVGRWPVSTARDGKETPTGRWTAQWLSRDHRSRLYDGAPMPFAVFYDGDYAIHGTLQTGRLGRPASHGCVRLSTANAALLFGLVEREGLGATLIEIRR